MALVNGVRHVPGDRSSNSKSKSKDGSPKSVDSLIRNGCTSDVRHELNMSHMLSTTAPTTGLHEALLSIHRSTNMSEWADTETIHGKY
jgi:hypothetical protein